MELIYQEGPILLGYVNNNASLADQASNSWRDLPPHRDEEQVQRDVDRAFVYYPNGPSQRGPNLELPLIWRRRIAKND